MAIQAFKAVDATGLARVDFLMDRVRETVYLNEINTMPGFTRISMYPKLFEASGISYPALADKLVKLALQRYADRQMNQIVAAQLSQHKLMVKILQTFTIFRVTSNRLCKILTTCLSGMRIRPTRDACGVLR